MKIPAAALCTQPGQAGSAVGHPAKVGAGSERRIPALECGGDHLAPLLFAQPSKLIAWGWHGPRVPQPSVQGSLCACCRPFQQRRGSAGASLGCKPPAQSRAEPLAVCGARARRSRLPAAHMWLCRCRSQSPELAQTLRSAQPTVGFGVGPGGVTATSRCPECPVPPR